MVSGHGREWLPIDSLLLCVYALCLSNVNTRNNKVFKINIHVFLCNTLVRQQHKVHGSK